MVQPRVSVLVPAHQHVAYLTRALGSLLDQDEERWEAVVLDDGSSDGTAEVAERYAARDPRVVFERNGSRLGMLHNTRRAFFRARERCPGAEYFAFASDHDVWEPEWLSSLVGALDGSPGAVLAYPRSVRISETGEEVRRPWSFDTSGVSDRRERMRAAFGGMVAGDMLYGLHRVDALERVGTYRPVLVPDRLMLSELSLLGEFVQVPEVLWRRRFVGRAALDRQRRAFFLDSVPAYARLPWWAVHSAVFAWLYAVRGEGRPEVGRAEGAVLARDYLAASLRLRYRRRLGRVMRWVERAHPRRLVGRAVKRFGPALGVGLRRALVSPRLHGLLTGPLAPALERGARLMAWAGRTSDPTADPVRQLHALLEESRSEYGGSVQDASADAPRSAERLRAGE